VGCGVFVKEHRLIGRLGIGRWGGREGGREGGRGRGGGVCEGTSVS